MTQVPTFTSSLLHPRYWLTWMGLGLLYLLVLLPYPVIYRLGTGLGRFSMRFLKRRFHIAQRNLELCFPDMSREQRDHMVLKNFESVGMGLFETGMAWFWPDRRIERWFKVSGLEHVQKARDNQQGVLLIGVHFLTLELGARIFGIHNPGVGVYRPHDNKLMDWIQTKGRMRSNKAMIDRKDLKGMIRSLKQAILSGMHLTTIMVRAAASLCPSLLLIKRQRQQEPTCWHAWANRRSFPLHRVVSMAVKVMNYCGILPSRISPMMTK